MLSHCGFSLQAELPVILRTYSRVHSPFLFSFLMLLTEYVAFLFVIDFQLHPVVAREETLYDIYIFKSIEI